MPSTAARCGVAATAFALVALPLAAVPAGAIPSGVLSKFAGTNQPIDSTEGPALSSGLNAPTDLAVDAAHNLYVADTFNHRVEKITPVGQLSYFAGDGAQGTPTAGTATASHLNGPSGVAVDSDGNVYIADAGNHRVLKVDGQGQLSFFAGTGASGTPVPGTNASQTPLMKPVGLAFDSDDNLFIADADAMQVLRVDNGSHLLTAFAGNGATGTPANSSTPTQVPIGMPADVAVDSGDTVHVSVPAAGIVFGVAAGTLTVEAGGGACPGSAASGTAVGFALCEPTGLAASGTTLYVAAAGNKRLFRLSGGGTLSTAAGDGTDGNSYGTSPQTRQIGAVSAVTMGDDGVGYLSDALNQSTISRYSLNNETVPDAPTAVSGTPGDQSASVEWTVPTNTGGAPITGYKVLLTPTTQGAGQPVNTTVDGSTTSTTVGSLTNGTTYTVQVAAMNIIGMGAYGDATQNVTPRTVPGMPRNVTLDASDQQLDVSFDAPQSNGGSSIIKYQYTWDGGTNVVDAPSMGFSVGNLTNGQAYTIQVRAVNAAGNGAWSAPVSGTPGTLPGRATVTGADPGDTEATVHWTAPTLNGGLAISGYLITLTPVAGSPVTASATGSDTSKTVTGLMNDTQYAVTVAAMNAAGTGPASTEPVSVTPISLATTVTSAHLATQIHVGGPLVTLPLWAMLDKPRTTIGVTLKSLVNGRTVASKPLSRQEAGTEFSGVMLFNDDDVPAWGSAQWRLQPEAPSNVGTFATVIRAHSLLGMKATRSGDWITITGSARAYHTVRDMYVPYTVPPIEIRRWDGDSWVTIKTVSTDANGNISTKVRIPWKVGLKLWMGDAAKIWGAESASAGL